MTDAGARLFPSTRWTRVLAAQADPAVRREVLEELVRPRWKALYVLARQGLDPTAAEDAVQSFLARLVSTDDEGGFLERLDPARGSLRAYLKAAFRRHLVNLHESRAAQKRGGGVKDQALHELEEQIQSNAADPEQLFNRTWAASLFSETMESLRAEFERGKRRGPFEIIEALLSFSESESYETLAEKYEMSVPQLKAFVHRSKLRFRALLRERVARTLSEGEDVDLAIRQLLEDLAS